jgi:hypothetical protein
VGRVGLEVGQVSVAVRRAGVPRGLDAAVSVLADQVADRIVTEARRLARRADRPAARAEEHHLVVGVHADAVPLLVHQPVMSPAQQHRVLQVRPSAVGPVLDVMAVREAKPAAGEAAAAVPCLERTPQRRRNRAGPSTHAGDPAVGRLHQHDPARVAGEAAERFS